MAAKNILRSVHDKEHNYTVISNKLAVEETRLSLKAKGLMMYLLARPDNWCFNIEDIQKHFSDGRDSVRSAWNELIRFEYVKRIEHRDAKGQMYYTTLVYEIPSQYDEKDAETSEDLYNG